MIRIKSIIAFFVVLTFDSFGQAVDQNCDDAKEFYDSFSGNCNMSIAAHNCIHLDITESYDFEGKELLFYWEMGDGNHLEGMEIDHCYSQPGEYKAVLSVFDPITDVMIAKELEVNVVIKPEFSLQILKKTNGLVGDTTYYDFDIDFPKEEYSLEHAYWRLGDGEFACGKDIMHIYHGIGDVTVDLIVLLSLGEQQQLLCDRDTVHISLNDKKGNSISSMLDSIENESRFLADDVHYQILEYKSKLPASITKLNTLTYGASYQLLIYRGNLIYDMPQVKIDSVDTEISILDSIKSTARLLEFKEPLKLESVFFDVDQNELTNKNKRTIKDNLTILNKFPDLNILIGVYTTSTGSLEKGVAYSKVRADRIREFMIAQGLDEHRIKIASPDNYRSLINSCVTRNNCGDYVDLSLDRRADFKVFSE